MERYNTNAALVDAYNIFLLMDKQYIDGELTEFNEWDCDRLLARLVTLYWVAPKRQPPNREPLCRI